MSRRMIGRYIVADDAIRDGQPTIRGTDILVADVLAMVAEGRDWASISKAWEGKVSEDAIGEVMRLARQALFEHLTEYATETVSS